MNICIPLFEDEKTPEFKGEEADLPPPPGGDDASKRISFKEKGVPQVHMDAMAFGMGCCCLQVTFQVNCFYCCHYFSFFLGVFVTTVQ